MACIASIRAAARICPISSGLHVWRWCVCPPGLHGYQRSTTAPILQNANPAAIFHTLHLSLSLHSLASRYRHSSKLALWESTMRFSDFDTQSFSHVLKHFSAPKLASELIRDVQARSASTRWATDSMASLRPFAMERDRPRWLKPGQEPKSQMPHYNKSNHL